MNESDFSRKLRKALEESGAWCVKLSDRFHASYPDLTGCYEGLAFSVENKVHPNKLSQGQEYELTRVVLAGGAAFVCTLNKKIKRIVLVAWHSGERAEFTDRDLKGVVAWLYAQLYSNIKLKASSASRTSPMVDCSLSQVLERR